MYKQKSVLGYKFRFAGRFKRKRERVIVYFKKGMMPVSSHNKLVEYGYYTQTNRFSAYSIRVWIYRNSNFAHKYFFKF